MVHILALNSGSSSLKFGLYRVDSSATHRLLSGEAQSIGDADNRFTAQDGDDRILASDTPSISNQQAAVRQITALLEKHEMPSPDAIGHRIVHGGPKLRQHCLIDDAAMRELEAASIFAPLHAPPALAVIRFAQEHFPGIPQIACFDTSFHADMPDVARVLPIPKQLQDEGIQRYGFHGLSCESILHQLADDLPRAMIIAHLGNGASVTAVRNGKSIDTSMGLTPSGGIIMGTRSGDLDPGILIYLMRQKKLDATGLEDLIDHHSGLLGISGRASDMRHLREAAALDEAARLAIEMFCYTAAKQIAAMIAVLGGADLIVFTGGIGENDPDTRAAICAGLSCFGINLDDARNRAADNPLSGVASRIRILVLPSEEDPQIARHSAALIQAAHA